ncbi:MAG: hypothetical protein ACK4FV_07610, partial [Candidatus Nitrosocaldus sp.]
MSVGKSLLALLALAIAITALATLAEEAYASHTDCRTEQGGSSTSYYYLQECYYYDYRERPIRYTYRAENRSWGSGNSQSTENITETWSYYDNNNNNNNNSLLKDHCRSSSYNGSWSGPGYAGSTSSTREDCEKYDSSARLIERKKVDEYRINSC